jgi:uncharacterized protein (TIGR02145 family)
MEKGTQAGQMMYWNGSDWILIAPGSTGQTLTMCNGVPTWGACPPSLPILTTNAIQSVTSSTAVSGGNISSDGGAAITERGICWSTSPNPTVALNTKTVDGAGSGSFSSNLTGLSPITTYYLRAYAINQVGTAYGNEISFSSTLGGNVTDIEGNTYETIIIGNQEWMAENLRVTKYKDGSSIFHTPNGNQWNGTTSGEYCYYNNNPINDSLYGKLYNWKAVDNPSGLCPTGWHVPSQNEWGTLISNLGGATVAGGKLKSVSSLWNQPNIANNSSGFSALPAGYRMYTADFLGLGVDAWFWTSTTNGDSCQCQAFCQQLNNTSESINGAWPYTGRKWGLPVRCVKN